MELRDKVARAMVERQHMELVQLDGGDHGYYGQLADAAIATMQEAGWQDAAFFRKALQSAPIIGMIESAAAFRERQDTWLADEYCKALKDET